MKKILFLISFVAAFGLLVNAQLIVTDHGGNTLNGMVHTISGPDTGEFAEELDLVNNFGTEINVYAKKVELSVITDSENYFCLGSCYPPNIYEASNSVAIGGGTTLSGLAGFSCHYNAKGNPGTTSMRYVFWTAENPTDTVYVDVNFVTGPNGKEEILTYLNVYPNPASDIVHLDYQLTEKDSWFTLYNMLGTEVKHIDLNDNSGSSFVRVSDLNAGVYFYTIGRGSDILKTERLVIK